MFAALFLLEWVGGIITSLVFTPLTWIGATPYVHQHVWAATLLGGAIISVPLYLIRTRPGEPITRQTVAVAQMLYSAILIHLTGGRIETHFHIFGSLALLAFYRDWRVLSTATLVVIVDHFMRGILWPVSAFGAADVGRWRWVEHAGWVLFEDVFLIMGCFRALLEMVEIARQQAEAIDAGVDMLRRTGSLARVGGWEIDLTSKKMTWSDEVYRIHEVEPGTPIDLETGIRFYAEVARPIVRRAIQTAIDTGEGWDFELPLITAMGKTIWVRVQGEAVHKNGVPTKLCGAFQEITDRKQIEIELRRSATHDRLTGLPNRALLHERLKHCLARTGPARRDFAVLFLDFDRFKLINDTLGHEAGDDLLRQIAARLRTSIPTSDEVFAGGNHSTVARLGGDEFVVILDALESPSAVTDVAARLLEVFSRPYAIAGHQIVSTASIGIVTSQSDYIDADDMLRDADIAMYEAKLAGKCRYVVFDASMHERSANRMQIETDLRAALGTDQLSLAYKPIVCLESNAMTRVEALLRWDHPTRGAILPNELLPVAEETGLIIPIGEWVLHAACQQFATWRRTLGELAPSQLNIHLSCKQFVLQDLPALIERVLGRSGMSPACLHLEVSETTLMKDQATTRRTLTAIKATGVKIDIDDFGSGPSALTSLNQFPIDGLKIDRTFTGNIESGRRFAALLQAIDQLARNMDLQVIAEGVETIDQVIMLQAMDFRFAQGHFFGGPMTAEFATKFLCQSGTARSLPNAYPLAGSYAA